MVTTKDIAKICGVSRGTVDRALHNRPGITPETKEKILKVVKDLEYRPNIIARSLVKGKTMSIGVVVFDLYNRFFSQVLNELEQISRSFGYFTYVTLTHKNPEVEKECLLNLTDRGVDGIILFSINKGIQYEEFLSGLKTPIVTIGNYVSKKWPFVGIDDRLAMKDAVYHVLRKGYEHIIYVCPSFLPNSHENIYTIEQRYEGFLEACKEMGINENKYNVVQHNNYKEQLENLIKNTKNKTAILCTSDIFALEVLDYFNEKSIMIPDNVGLMGFDNIDVLQYIKPGLTTIEYPMRELAKEAVKTLIECMNGNEVVHNKCLKHHIINRNSL